MAAYDGTGGGSSGGGIGRRKLNIVVEGCCHGELPNIYASVLKMQQVLYRDRWLKPTCAWACFMLYFL